ncbi:MAG: class I SAM-dependent methyltransferase [Caulobacteraceae bacterium]|nr:class I SAM-dependent methyltransferase [Caulobacteraceae bacterium]
MRRGLMIAVLATALAAAGAPALAQMSPSIAAALADPNRPAKDQTLDASRRPAEIMAFIGLKPGQTIVDVWPGAYWDRLFADVVGPSGQVIAWLPNEAAKAEKLDMPKDGSHPYPEHPNVVAYGGPINSFTVPSSVDVVWIRQNYHDLYDPFMGPADVAGFDKAVFKALKPGGVFVVIDHSAPAGSGLADTNTTHRIDPAVVKKDMAAAGFQFVGESPVLHNPDDKLDKLVFDPSIRGRTDQFIYVFRKP